MEIQDFKTEQISDVRIPWVICAICKEKRSGILHIMGSNKKLGRRLFFHEGLLQFAHSNLENDRLGKILVDAGRITQEDLHAAMLQKHNARRLGRALIQNGTISQKEINYYIGMQIRNILFSTFELEDGLYFFEEKPISLPKDLKLKVLVGHLVLNGIRSMKNLFLVDDEISRIGDNPLAQGKNPVFPFDKLPLTQNEAYLYSRLDGRLKVNDLMKIVGLPREVVYKFIYAGMCLEFISVVQGSKVVAMNRFTRAFNRDESTTPESLDLENLTPEELEVRKKIQNKSAQISVMDCWQFLEVKEGESQEGIKKNYIRLTQEYHPDLFQEAYVADLIPNLNKIISYLNHSYNTLTNPQSIEAYRQRLESRKEADKVSLEQKQKAAEQLYNKGQHYLLSDDLFNAHRHFELALKYFPKTARYWCAKGQTELHNPKWEEKAIASLKEAIQLDSYYAEPHLHLAQIYLKQGRPEKALAEVNKLLDINPVHEDGLEMQEKLGQTANKGFLKRLTKKK
ncbi:MAG: hypothetical protein CSA81_09975 [Acidobacteria bacterium]|nr:MAG: hypothetical protein CSA81_09975 [Acidobacteriota bacterium]PIE90801.1 MAG: hypothetical protein CR997_04030 [Acidobacteriota bacterium]